MKSFRLTALFLLSALAALALFPLRVAVIGAVFVHESLRQAGAPLAPLALGATGLTNLIPDCYAALDVVSRELVGFLPAVMRTSSAERLAVGANALRSGITPANAAGGDITPSMSLPSASEQTIANASCQITKSRFFPFSWSGEDQLGVEQGPGYLTVKQDQIAQAMRAAVNEMEADLAATARKGASRAYGTSGTTPFASDLSASAEIAKILDDNGAPQVPYPRHLVINTKTTAKLRTLTQLTKANEAADTTMLRQGELLDIHGFKFRQSAQLTTVTKGTGTSYVVNGATAKGATTITLKTGSGTVLAGDVITLNGVQYVVKTGTAAPGDIVIQAPGLLAAAADGDTVTINNNFTPNVAFTGNALLLATRLPALPKEGDLAIMRETITDARSGISFEVAVYGGYRMVTYHISVAWGQTVLKPEHVALMLG